jgi:hypothetical protein
MVPTLVKDTPRLLTSVALRSKTCWAFDGEYREITSVTSSRSAALLIACKKKIIRDN